MTTRPINLKPWEVRAFLDGRKTRITRALRDQPEMHGCGDCTIRGHRGPVDYLMREIYPRFWVSFAVGDLLWGREAFITGFNIDDETGRPVGDQRVWYRADKWPAWYDADSEATLDSPPWRSSAVMPRHFSRLTLAVEAVKVCRVQDITEEEAIAEGFVEIPEQGASPIDALSEQWRIDHGPGSWDSNPWVASYTVRAVRQDIERMVHD